MRLQHVTAWVARTLAVFIMVLFLCPVLAYANTTEADLVAGSVSPEDAVYTQDMIGTVSRPTETIAINKSYSRNASNYDVHNYRFKSKGGNYVLKINNKVKGSTSSLNVSPGGVLKGYLTASATTGKSGKILFLGEWCRKGANSFDLGTIKKGTTVNLSFLAYPRSSSSKWTFKVERKTLKMAKSNTTISVKDVKYTGKALKPAVTVKYKGKKLKKGTDYTLKYSNNTEVGNAEVKVTGKGNYKGSLTKKFKVKPLGKVYVLVYGSAKNEKPSSNHNVSIMKGAVKNLKISGYEFKNNNSYRTVVNAVGFNSEDFRKSVEKRFKKAKKNDLCIIYLNAHGATFDYDGDGVPDITPGVASDTEFWTNAYWSDRADFNWKVHDDKCDLYRELWYFNPRPKEYADSFWYNKGYGFAESKNYWSWRGMLDMFGKYAKGQIIFFPEVCYSGNFVNCAKDCDASDRIAIVSAADSSTGAHVDNWPTYFFDQSSFTNALVKGLKGHTWVKGKSKKSASKVTLRSLYSYIKKDPKIKKYKMNPQSYVGSEVLSNLVLYKK